MKVLVYSIYNYTTPHFETELEIVENHLEEGDEVHVIMCDKILESCMYNVIHDKDKCGFCQSLGRHNFRKIGVDSRNIHHLKFYQEVDQIDIPTFNNFDELKEYSWNGFDIGMAVTSSLVSQIGDTIFNPKELKDRIDKNIKMAINVNLNARDLIKKIEPDLVYLFNGRFADQRPFLRECERNNIEYKCHERGATLFKYDLYENALPHDLNNLEKVINKASEDFETKKSLGEKWFFDRKGGKDQAWESFVKDQSKEKLPVDFDPKKRNVAIFISSEDEFYAVDGWKNPFYSDQNSAIAAISEKFKHRPEFIFHIREHPILKGLDNEQTRGLRKLIGKNVQLIAADSDVHSYSLMDWCEKTITFGSTAGVEATFWGKPSILVGKAFYQSLDCVYQPKTKEQFFQFIEDQLEPKNKNNAIKYGIWEATHGYEFKRFQPNGYFDGTYNGKKLKTSFKNRIRNKIRKLI